MVMPDEAMRRSLLFLSERPALKEAATSLSPLKKVAERFVAGEQFEEALARVRELNAQGCMATFDHLEEAVQRQADARAEVGEYRRLLAGISRERVNANVSIKLTQFGLQLSEELCFQNARQVVSDAASRGNFVRVDMEGSAVTEATLRVFERLLEEFGPDTVGIALQSYLRRTEDDAKRVLAQGARIRLCKGAYAEPPAVAFPDKADVDRNYLRVSELLLKSGGYHAIASHDEKMIDAARAFAAGHGLDKSRFEFQMLYGVRRELQKRLADEGYRVRVYVPYGKSWYPYFMRRLAERPANVWFIAKNFFRA